MGRMGADGVLLFIHFLGNSDYGKNWAEIAMNKQLCKCEFDTGLYMAVFIKH